LVNTVTGKKSPYIHARGWLVACYRGVNFLHLDGYLIRCGRDSGTMAPEWPATFRTDQIRPEWNPADHTESAIKDMIKIEEEATPRALPRLFITRRRWEEREAWFEAQRLRLEGLNQALVSAKEGHPLMPTPRNCLNEIVLETADGLKQGDKVDIYIRERNQHGKGLFVAEYRNLRHVMFESGGCTAYPMYDVTKQKVNEDERIS
jgi:hypothetical protein